MNRQLLFSAITSVLITTGVFAQKKSKTYKETFNVGENTVVNINTSNADIEFETWGKNQVEVTGVIVIDGATDDEARNYFEKDVIEIKGNSNEIDISTELQNILFFNKQKGSWISSGNGYNIEPLFEESSFPELENLSELSELSELVELAIIPEMPVIPNLPAIPDVSFDYKAYTKDGDKYMKKWKKQFEKKYNKEFEKNFEIWSKEFEKLNKENINNLKTLAYEKRRNKLIKDKSEGNNAKLIAYEKRRNKLLAERNEKITEKSLKNKAYSDAVASLYLSEEKLKDIREKLKSSVDTLQLLFNDSLRISKPNTFYFSSEGNNKQFKIKKTIKIKMPKSVKLKMNVRHGEVKLASTTKNIDASLQYASLLASTIEGNETNIRVSYSPVEVQKWNYGQLKTDYSNRVNIKEVGELSLNTTSSNVVINKLNESVLLTSNLGMVKINSVATNFKDIDVSIQNGKFSCTLPKTPLSIYINNKESSINYPVEWTVERTKNFDNIVYKGYQTNLNPNKTIRVDAKHSEVVLEN